MSPTRSWRGTPANLSGPCLTLKFGSMNIALCSVRRSPTIGRARIVTLVQAADSRTAEASVEVGALSICTVVGINGIGVGMPVGAVCDRM